MFLISSVYIAAWGNCTFYDPESLQNTLFDETLQTLLTLHIAGLRNNNGKSVIVKSWNIVRRTRATVPILE